MFIVSVII